MSQELQGLLDLQGGALPGLNGRPRPQALPALHPVETGIKAEGEALASARAVPILLWDLPTRLFHWGLVASVSTAIATGLAGGNWMVWHGRAGIAIAGLLAFRMVWGFVGGRHARFKSFVPGPKQLFAYLQGRWRGLGHNPLGALSVLALLALLAAQVITGLLGNDEIAFSGPLVAWVSSEVSLAWTHYHKSYGQWGLFLLLGLHLLAIAFYRWRRQDLIGPMLSGDKQLPVAVPASADSWATRVFALTLLLACAAGVYLLVTPAPPV